MPIYTFKCPICVSIFEVQLKISEPLSSCPICLSTESLFEKLPSKFAVVNSASTTPNVDVTSSVCMEQKQDKKIKDSCHSHGNYACSKNSIDKMIERYEKS